MSSVQKLIKKFLKNPNIENLDSLREQVGKEYKQAKENFKNIVEESRKNLYSNHEDQSKYVENKVIENFEKNFEKIFEDYFRYYLKNDTENIPEEHIKRFLRAGLDKFGTQGAAQSKNYIDHFVRQVGLRPVDYPIPYSHNMGEKTFNYTYDKYFTKKQYDSLAYDTVFAVTREIVSKHVSNRFRYTIVNFAEKYRFGYYIALSPAPCKFCLLVASNGLRLRKADKGLDIKRPHGGCKCHIVFLKKGAKTPENIRKIRKFYHEEVRKVIPDNQAWMREKYFYNLVESGKFYEKTGIESKYDTKEYKKANMKIAGVKRGKPMTFEQANTGRVNPNYGKGGGYSINCQTCVVVFEARQRGYDVQALPNTKGSMLEKLSYETNRAWIDPKTGTHPEYIQNKTLKTAKTYLKFIKEIVEPKGRYTIQFKWKGRRNAWHIVNLDTTPDGLLRIKDNQVTGKYKDEFVGDKQVLWYLSQMQYISTYHGIKYSIAPEILRIDNQEFNSEIINHIMEKANQ